MVDKIGLRIDRLRATRERRGFTQRELGRRCNISNAMIQKYEAGVNDPTSAVLRQLAEHLNVSVDYLLGLTDDPYLAACDLSLDDAERTMVDTYRNDGWPGVIRLGVERLTK